MKIINGTTLNTVSLGIFATILLVIAVLIFINIGKQHPLPMISRFIPRICMGIGWLLWSISYWILLYRIYLPIEQAKLHVILYKVILTFNSISCSLFAFSSMQNKIPKIFNFFNWTIFFVGIVVLIPIIWFTSDMGVKLTPYNVEIIPSMTCQYIMSSIFVVQAVTSLVQLKYEDRRMKNTLLGVAIFNIILIPHIMIVVIFGYQIISGILILMARIMMGLTVLYFNVIRIDFVKSESSKTMNKLSKIAKK